MEKDVQITDSNFLFPVKNGFQRLQEGAEPSGHPKYVFPYAASFNPNSLLRFDWPFQALVFVINAACRDEISIISDLCAPSHLYISIGNFSENYCVNCRLRFMLLRLR